MATQRVKVTIKYLTVAKKLTSSDRQEDYSPFSSKITSTLETSSVSEVFKHCG